MPGFERLKCLLFLSLEEKVQRSPKGVGTAGTGPGWGSEVKHKCSRHQHDTDLGLGRAKKG